MSLMDNAKLPSLRDKIEAQAKVVEGTEVNTEEVKVKKVKKASKKKKNEK